MISFLPLEQRPLWAPHAARARRRTRDEVRAHLLELLRHGPGQLRTLAVQMRYPAVSVLSILREMERDGVVVRADGWRLAQ